MVTLLEVSSWKIVPLPPAMPPVMMAAQLGSPSIWQFAGTWIVVVSVYVPAAKWTMPVEHACTIEAMSSPAWTTCAPGLVGASGVKLASPRLPSGMAASGNPPSGPPASNPAGASWQVEASMPEGCGAVWPEQTASGFGVAFPWTAAEADVADASVAVISYQYCQYGWTLESVYEVAPAGSVAKVMYASVAQNV